MKSVTVYCGAGTGASVAYSAEAEALGKVLAAAGTTLVYGGARTGLMGALADAVLDAGGSVVGIIPEALVLAGVAHSNLTRLEVVGGMHERKARMIELGDALLALPGGAGTIDELFEALTWQQLGFHGKPIGILNVAGYYDTLLTWMARGVTEGFFHGPYFEQLVVEPDPGVLLERLFEQDPIPGLFAAGQDDVLSRVG